MYWRFHLTCPYPPDIARQHLRAQTLAPLGLRDSRRQAPDPMAPRSAAFVGEVDATGFDIQARRMRLYSPIITGTFRIDGRTTAIAVEIMMAPLRLAAMAIALMALCAISLQMIFDDSSETLLQMLGPIAMAIALATVAGLDFAFDARAIRRELCAIFGCTAPHPITHTQNTGR